MSYTKRRLEYMEQTTNPLKEQIIQLQKKVKELEQIVKEKGELT